jgi:DNA/RNA-binding domain of Phe-tRNA-synthetase-like protein
MQELYYSISSEIFQRFPGYVRGVVIAHAVSNRPSPDELVQLLRQAEASLRGRLDIDHLAEEPRIKSWREAYRSFGAKPSEFRASIEALARRVLRNEPLPSINALVDIGNVVSLRHLVPAGGHAIDVLKGDIALRMATGEEDFVPFGSNEREHPLPGEIIFAEGDTVLTRRWTWRQANHTLTLPETQAVEFNVDGLPPTSHAEVVQACEEIRALIVRFCGGRLRVEILSPTNPRIRLDG